MLTYLEDSRVPRCGHSETLINVWRQIEKVRRGFRTQQGLLDHLKLFQITHYIKKPIIYGVMKLCACKILKGA